SGRVRPPPLEVGGSGRGSGPQQGQRWHQLSPRQSRTADDMLKRNGGGGGGGGGGDTGIFGETSHTPGGSPWFSSEGRRDSRRAILLKLTYLNLLLALVLITVGAAGPKYPGHSGTTDNPVPTWDNRRLTTHVSPLYRADCPTGEVDSANASILRSALIVGLVIWLTQPCSAHCIHKQVDQGGAAATLLTSVVSAFTCLGSFAVVTVDINYIAGCCSLLEDNCEESNLCTQFVDDCCISDDVKDYCGNPSYHAGAVSMIFVMFVSTLSMVVMASTITCRCWLDSDPEKQALLMVLTGSPYGSPRGSNRLQSPKFSPRNTLLSGLGFGDTGGTPTKQPSSKWYSSSPGREARHGSTNGGRAAVGGGGEEKTGLSPAREKCLQCGAVFGDLSTLFNHVERFHSKVLPSKRVRVPSLKSAARPSLLPAYGGGGGGGDNRIRSLSRKGSTYEPDEGPAVVLHPPVVGVVAAMHPSP
ncbi:unnamed protein product, partial [Pylaiella littoralis]